MHKSCTRDLETWEFATPFKMVTAPEERRLSTASQMHEKRSDEVTTTSDDVYSQFAQETEV